MMFLLMDACISYFLFLTPQRFSLSLFCGNPRNQTHPLTIFTMSQFKISHHQAVCFVGFLVGFITVLCIGNYFRAKRAQERQRQRRLAKLATSTSNGGATRSSHRSNDGYSQGGDTTGSGYEAPNHNPANVAINSGVRA